MEYIIETVKTENYEMDYLKFGNGPKNMLILPGISTRPLCGDPLAFVESFKVFGDDYTVYLFDRKKNKKKPYLTKDMATDTLDAIKKLGIKDIYGYGASQGGQILMHMNIMYPKLFKKIVLASTSYYMNGSCYDFFEQLTNLALERNSRSLASLMVRRIYSKEFCDNYLDAIVNLNKDLSEKELDEFIALADYSDRLYLLNDLDKIKAKALVIASEKDEVYGYEPSLQMTLKLNCDCVIYDEYSHAVYDEAPDFKDRMKKFFDE